MTDGPRKARPAGTDVADFGDRRGIARPCRKPNEAAVERVVQRIAKLSEFTDAQIRQIAAIALVAVSVDDADRQKRDETARDNRLRLQALGRD